MTVEASDANDVAKQLSDKGFIVKKKRQYNAVRKGGYLGMEGAKSGERLSKGSTVTILESMGPGVPEGTVGSSPKQAETVLKDMGVTVTEHEVISENSGKVTVTTPADGQPVTDTKDGIHLGVGIQGDGIPVEIAGMDKDKAEDSLTSKGYAVTLEPRFSSRQYLGKIVGADPGIGVPSDQSDVTLYYGVDTSKRYDVLAEPLKNGSEEYADATHADRLAGTYCTEGGDCLTLSQGSTGYNHALSLNGKQVSDAYDGLGLCPYAQSAGMCTPSPLATDSFSAEQMQHFLLSGDTGAFELFEGLGLPNCGADIFFWGPNQHCENGVNKIGQGTNTGLTYDSKDFFVYMPVDAKLSALESDGYFAGSSDYKPDADRPYLIRRDNAKYSPVKIDSQNNPKYDPLTPSRDGRPMPFKDAPNKKNVYYLVETPIDWSLIDGTVSVPDSKASSADNSQSAWKQFAGEYIFSAGVGGWGTQLTVNADGTFSGRYHDTDMGIVGDDYPNGSSTESVFSGKFTGLSKNGDGTYTTQCDADSLSVQGHEGDQRIEKGMLITTTEDVYGLTPCGKFTVYPKGYEVSYLSEDIRSWSGGAAEALPLSGTSPYTILTNEDEEAKGMSFYEQPAQ